MRLQPQSHDRASNYVLALALPALPVPKCASRYYGIRTKATNATQSRSVLVRTPCFHHFGGIVGYSSYRYD
jgi:hypothetical protein